MKSKKVISHKARMNIIKVVVAVAAILFLLTPAASTSPQVDMYSMVTSLGLDKGENGIRCTAEVILPEENQGAKAVTIIIDGEGETLSSALENLSIGIGRTLDLSHCAILVIGKDKAAEGVVDEFEYLLSSSRVSPQISTVLSGNKDAGEFVEKLHEYSQKLDADNLLRYTDFGSHNYSQTLIQFLKSTGSKSKSAVMPCIEMGKESENSNAVEADEDGTSKKEEEPSEDESGGGGESGEGGGGDSGGSQSSAGGGGGGGESGGGGGSGDQTIIKATDKIGGFVSGKLESVWGAVEGNGLAWSDLKTKHGHMILEDLQFKNQKADKMSCYLVKKKVKIKSRIHEGKPVLQIKVNAQFSLEERYKIYRLSDNGNNDAVYDVIRKGLEKEISRTLHSVLEKSKQDNIDALLTRDYFYRYHKKQFDKLVAQGQDILQMTTLDIKFDISIN